MAGKYTVKVTHQALEQMQEIADYITQELCAPDAANYRKTGGGGLVKVYNVTMKALVRNG